MPCSFSELETNKQELEHLQNEYKLSEQAVAKFMNDKNDVFETFFQTNKLSFFGKLSSSVQKSYQNKVALFLATSPYDELRNLDNQDTAEKALIGIIQKLRDDSNRLKKLIDTKEETIQKIKNSLTTMYM